MKNTSKRTCLYCQRVLEGRRDKKYCDTNCRVLYHQQKQKREEAQYLKVLDILKTNRKILKSLNPSGHSTIEKSFLINLGYDFNYFTNTYEPKSGGTYYFCFEYGLREIDAKPHKVNIVNLQPYVEKYRHPLWLHVEEKG